MCIDYIPFPILPAPCNWTPLCEGCNVTLGPIIVVSTDCYSRSQVFDFVVRLYQVGYERELREAMSYVFGSTIICDSLEIAKQVCYGLERNVPHEGFVHP